MTPISLLDYRKRRL